MAGKYLANQIGDHYAGKEGSLGGELVHKLSHAALGCGMAVASSGSDQSCGAGAFGGVTGELLAQGMGDNYNLNAKDEKNERKAFLNTVTTLTSLSAQIVNLDGGIAGSTASNAVENNYLMGDLRKIRNYAGANCAKTGDENSCRTAIILERQDKESNEKAEELIKNCEGQKCEEIARLLQNDLLKVDCKPGEWCEDKQKIGGYISQARGKAGVITPIYPLEAAGLCVISPNLCVTALTNVSKGVGDAIWNRKQYTEADVFADSTLGILSKFAKPNMPGSSEKIKDYLKEWYEDNFYNTTLIKGEKNKEGNKK